MSAEEQKLIKFVTEIPDSVHNLQWYIRAIKHLINTTINVNCLQIVLGFIVGEDNHNKLRYIFTELRRLSAEPFVTLERFESLTRSQQHWMVRRSWIRGDGKVKPFLESKKQDMMAIMSTSQTLEDRCITCGYKKSTCIVCGKKSITHCSDIMSICNEKTLKIKADYCSARTKADVINPCQILLRALFFHADVTTDMGEIIEKQLCLCDTKS